MYKVGYFQFIVKGKQDNLILSGNSSTVKEKMMIFAVFKSASDGVDALANVSQS